MTESSDDGFAPLYLAKAERALECIATHDPRRLDRLRRDVRRILVSYLEGSHYMSSEQTIVLRWDQLAGRSREEVASTLIHEATHARHHHKGIDYSAELRPRLEASCVRQEIAFARRLPDGSALVEARSRKLDEPWWTDEHLVERQVETLQRIGAPRWLQRLGAAIIRRRLHLRRRFPG
jgi:hypothetical protein